MTEEKPSWMGRCAVVLVHDDGDVREFFDCRQNQVA